MKLFLAAGREDSNAMVQLIMHYSHEWEKQIQNWKIIV